MTAIDTVDSNVVCYKKENIPIKKKKFYREIN